jgi:ferredoxin/flavodoxin
MKQGKVNRALVLWYSQTGHTKRCGKVLAESLVQKGLVVEALDIREFQKERVCDFDLLVLGSPVFYYDTPSFVKDYIGDMPNLKGMPVASYVTFGGPEGNQDNANYSILNHLSERNGVPVARSSFQSLSSFPLAWSKGKVDEKTWDARDLPNEDTFQSVQDYAGDILGQIKENQPKSFVKKLTLRESFTLFDLEYWTKKLIKNHSLVEENCVQCGDCVEKCPANAIDLETYRVDTIACVLCFGCINTCQYQAVHMEYSKERVLGFKEFLEQHHIQLHQPRKLQT